MPLQMLLLALEVGETWGEIWVEEPATSPRLNSLEVREAWSLPHQLIFLRLPNRTEHLPQDRRLIEIGETSVQLLAVIKSKPLRLFRKAQPLIRLVFIQVAFSKSILLRCKSMSPLVQQAMDHLQRRHSHHQALVLVDTDKSQVSTTLAFPHLLLLVGIHRVDQHQPALVV